MVEKILWLSEALRIEGVTADGRPIVIPGTSGYSRATVDIVTRLLERNFDVSIADWGLPLNAAFETPKKNVICRVYGVATKEELLGATAPTFGRNRLQKVLRAVKPGLLIALGDYRMVSYLAEIRERPPTVFVNPLDVPLPEEWLDVLEAFDELVAISRFGYEEMRRHGLKPHLIPLGVDTKFFHPLDEAKVREIKLRSGFDGNDYIHGVVAVNIPRKNYPAVIEAFAKFVRERRNALLYMHTSPLPEGGVGWNLPKLVERFAAKYGVPELIDRCMFGMEGIFAASSVQPQPVGGGAMHRHEDECEHKHGHGHGHGHGRGVCRCRAAEEASAAASRRRKASMNTIYNMFSVNVLLSQSEGFGLSVLESMAAGVPQIVADHTALTELVKEPRCGELVRVAHEVLEPQGGYVVHRYFVDTDDAAEKMIKLYDEPELRAKYGEAARRKALEYDYDEKIIPEWEKLIESF